MEIINEKEILLQLTFEIAERISRFSSHLDQIRSEFYNDEDSIIKDKLIFINSYEDCLARYLHIVAGYVTIIENSNPLPFQQLFRKLEIVLKSINDLHLKHLIHLPRPNEPIELRRFGRVIKKQIFNIEKNIPSNDEKTISIYINEEIGDVSYATDPLQNFKQDQINTLIFDFNQSFENTLSLQYFENSASQVPQTNIHITISRIDANNPCHWPTLLHEVSHKLMNQHFFENGNIHDDFLSYLKNQEAEAELPKILDSLDINLESWLTECWCDLFACASIGPSFYFSQYHSFLNYFHHQDNRLYPPNIFRAKLIEKILLHRFKSTLKSTVLDKDIELTQEILSLFEKNQRLRFSDDRNVRKLFSLFKEFFLNHLFRQGANEGVTLSNTELNEKFQRTVRYVNEISISKIHELTGNLDKGYPIPSYIESKSPYLEKPTSVQEILLAGWSYRNTSFKGKIITELLKISKSSNIDPKSLLKEVLCRHFNRFDQSLLRSIQVSEYFDALMDDEVASIITSNTVTTPTKNKAHQNDLLVDWEIQNCLIDESIKIIPIISLKHQQGSTSLDIRLGTTFELYLPNQFGILDFADKESIKKIHKSSQKSNLDFLNSIAINPGQFILGHSMEYIKLSENISADLEGRSSFARLGIEIHMTAGFIDPGFEGVLTFEIFNAGPSPVKLYPGMRIGQLRFTSTNTPSNSYNKKNTAKYAGLLEYHSSKQNTDYEMIKISNLKERESK